ncbi:hypothetical protein BDZ89DRAFT_1070642 [Hymenopellis radicata]|nr:hypothetical protein BDZ89DRAFT_1070642 [Hymenopellis radicata]
MAPPSLLTQFEAWDTYKGANIAADGPLNTASTQIKKDLKSALSSASKVRQTQTRHVFRSWKHGLESGQKDAAAPLLLAFLLAHQYDATTDFKASVLKETDARLLRDIAPFAKAYGFDLHLAYTTYTQAGVLTLDEYSRTKGVAKRNVLDRFGLQGDEDDLSDYDFDGDDYDVDPNVAEIDEVDETYIEFPGVFSLNGTPMEIFGYFVDELEAETDGDPNLVFVNENISDCVNGKEADYIRTAEFDRTDEDSGMLCRTYRRCALIITPKKSDSVRFTVDFRICEKALKTLQSSSSKAPIRVEDQMRLVLIVLLRQFTALPLTSIAPGKFSPTENKVEALFARVVKVLRACAVRWKKVDLFVDLLKACGDRPLALVGIDELVSAYSLFAWSDLQAAYTDALLKSSSSALRNQLVQRLLAAATKRGDSGVVSWCQSQSGQMGPVTDTVPQPQPPPPVVRKKRPSEGGASSSTGAAKKHRTS